MAATGVDYERAVSASTVENCHFTDIGGTALLVGTFPHEGFETHVPYKPFHEQELCTGITIRNNLIEEVTNEDWGGVGIGAGYVKNIHIIHNEVCHVNYSGICVGWGWTLLESGMRAIGLKPITSTTLPGGCMMQEDFIPSPTNPAP